MKASRFSGAVLVGFMVVALTGCFKPVIEVTDIDAGSVPCETKKNKSMLSNGLDVFKSDDFVVLTNETEIPGVLLFDGRRPMVSCSGGSSQAGTFPAGGVSRVRMANVDGATIQIRFKGNMTVNVPARIERSSASPSGFEVKNIAVSDRDLAGIQLGQNTITITGEALQARFPEVYKVWQKKAAEDEKRALKESEGR